MQSTYLIALINLLVLLNVHAQNSNFCKKLLKSPNFDVDRIVGKPWRVYFTWVLDYGDSCVEMSFKKLNRTSEIKQRFSSDLGRYMKNQIAWEDATLLFSLYSKGKMTKQSLLFPESQKGSFKGVHDFADRYTGYILKHSVVHYQLVIKLFRNGKFLLLADCKNGFSFLMARPNEIVHRFDVESLASEISDDSGYTACTINKGLEGILLDDDDNKIM